MIYPVTAKRARRLRNIALTAAAILILTAGALVAFLPH